MLKRATIKKIVSVFALLVIYSAHSVSSFAETVTGNGYTLVQTINPISGSVSGNGYSVQQTSQVNGTAVTGNGYTSQAIGSYVAPVVSTPPATGGSGSGGGSGYYVFPPFSTTTSTIVKPGTILSGNGSTCSTRIVISQPIDTVSKSNDKTEVKKLQVFLNTYENEKLVVDGIYKKQDIAAVKRWQEKYRAAILAPMQLKKPTGTVYSLSMRQIERQTTASCGQAILVHACPFFKTTSSYGDKGIEVKKIQQFLNIVQGEKLPIDGRYGTKTRDAVKRFQRYNKKDVVNMFKFSFISGNWNTLTKKKANQIIGCDILE